MHLGSYNRQRCTHDAQQLGFVSPGVWGLSGWFLRLCGGPAQARRLRYGAKLWPGCTNCRPRRTQFPANLRAPQWTRAGALVKMRSRAVAKAYVVAPTMGRFRFAVSVCACAMTLRKRTG